MTALQTPATTGAVSMALLASRALVPQATQACAVRARWMSAAASPVATAANVWTWWTNTFAAVFPELQVGLGYNRSSMCVCP